MAELIADCPRCGSQRITFDLLAAKVVDTRYDWKGWHEAFCICRHCGRSTVYLLADRGIEEARAVKGTGLPNVKLSVNNFCDIERHISVKDRAPVQPPEHLPEDILAVFNEGASCLSLGCFNAASTMFRLCVDLATTVLLPPVAAQEPNARIRRDLGLRLPWLIEHGLLPGALKDLSHCIKEDGNDGAHRGTLTRADAEDLLDFITALLERLYTEPKRIALAQERRQARRNPS